MAAEIAARNKRILAVIFIDEKFRIVRKIVITKCFYNISFAIYRIF